MSQRMSKITLGIAAAVGATRGAVITTDIFRSSREQVAQASIDRIDTTRIKLEHVTKAPMPAPTPGFAQRPLATLQPPVDPNGIF
jgi:hypothetical protein